MEYWLSLLACLSWACGDDHQGLDLLPPGTDGAGCVPVCGGDDEGGTGETDEEGGFVCGEKELTAQVGRSRLILVLDQSRSMGWAWDHDADPGTPASTRWVALHEVVAGIVGSFGDDLDLGLMMFPSADSVCTVAEAPQVPVGPDNGPAILDYLPSADVAPDFLETPTVSALESARAHLQSLGDQGARAAVLITDGEPTCGRGLGEAASVVGAALEEDGIVTYAVGLAVPEWAVPGFEQVAEAGGAPATGDKAFFDIQSQEELEEAVALIAEQLQVCTIILDPEPEVPEKLEIRVDGQVVPVVEDCETQDGWVYAEPDAYEVVSMCGTYCEKVMAGGIELIADYACPAVMPGP